MKPLLRAVPQPQANHEIRARACQRGNGEARLFVPFLFFCLFLFSNARPCVDAPQAIPVSRSPRMQQEIDLLSLSGSYGGVVVAAGSCYRPQVRCADKQTMTNPLPKPPPPPRPASPLGLRRQKFVNGFRDCRHTWDSSGFPNNRVTRQEGESGAGRGEVGGEASSANAIHVGRSTGATFHKIKVPLCFWRNATVFCCCDATRMRKELQKQSGRGTESMGFVRTGSGGGG